MKRIATLVFVPVLIAACLFVVAYFREGYWREIFVGIGLVALAFAADQAINEAPQFAAVAAKRLPTILATLFLLSTVYLGYLAFANTTRPCCSSPPPPPYPIASGLIADFSSVYGGPAETRLETQCSLMSDSAQSSSTNDLASRIAYSRVDGDHYGDGYLRIRYELVSRGKGTSFVGIYCPFSFPPAEVFDASMFHSVKFRVRMAGRLPAKLPTVRVIVYSRNLPHEAKELYAFPEVDVLRSDLTTNWSEVVAPFEKFHAPPYVTYQVSLDPSSVFQIGFLLEGEPQAISVGELDLDDIRFSKD